jgi:Tfp pilus assembly major pilin PilA
VELVNSERTANQDGSKERSVNGNEFPHSRVVVGEYLELGVQVEVQEHKASKGSGGVTRRHRLEAVVDLLPVTRADAAVEHDLAVSIGDVASNTAILIAIVCGTEAKTIRNDRLADSEEVRTKSSNEPLDEDLEDSGGDERVQQTDGSVVDVPEAASTDLNNQEDGKGNEKGHESSSPDGNDFVAKRIRELRVNNLAVLEDDGEAATRRWISHVDTKSNGAHGGHGDDVQSGGLDPCHLGLLTPKHASLLLLVVSAGGSCSVCRCRCSAAVEETHSCESGWCVGVRCMK